MTGRCLVGRYSARRAAAVLVWRCREGKGEACARTEARDVVKTAVTAARQDAVLVGSEPELREYRVPRTGVERRIWVIQRD